MKLKHSLSMPMKVYATLLLLYPEAFRSAYGDEMLQLFGDCYRDARETGHRSEMLKLWLSSLADVMVNACAERLKQTLTWRWIFGSVRFSLAMVALFGSGAIFGWIVTGITVFLLVPWDLGIPPAGTFAESVNNLFDLGIISIWLPGSVVLLCEITAFAKSLFSQRYRLTTLALYFTLLNIASAVIGTLLILAGMLVARIFFPNTNTWEGDQSNGVALVYWGLILVGGFTVFFAYQAWKAPSLLWLKSKRKIVITQ
jgi:hypothetical protein